MRYITIQTLDVDLKVSKDVDIFIKHMRVKENGARTSPRLLAQTNSTESTDNDNSPLWPHTHV